MIRGLWFAAGILCLALGAIGAVVPLMPTTVFLILAAAAFARSSPRLEAWLLGHPRFGPLILGWRERGAIPLPAKLLATGGIAAGYAAFLFAARPALPLAILVAAVMAAILAFILTRPSA